MELMLKKGKKKMHLNFIQMPKMSNNMRFGVVADIYVAKKKECKSMRSL